MQEQNVVFTRSGLLLNLKRMEGIFLLGVFHHNKKDSSDPNKGIGELRGHQSE